MDFLTIRMLDFSKPFIASPPPCRGGDDVVVRGTVVRRTPLTSRLTPHASRTLDLRLSHKWHSGRASLHSAGKFTPTERVMAKKENTRTVEVVVSADLVELAAGDKRPDVAAYAFSAGGKLLDSRVLDAKGNAALKLPVSAQATSVRVLVGPRLPKEAGLDEV